MQVPFEIDYVFPWVNDTDKVWRNTYKQYCKSRSAEWRINELEKERYRDWGLLKFLLRSIAANLPWIRKLVLIVSNIEQVPQWVNQETVTVVLHKDFIPERFLPTFNSTAIEMFLPNIKELGDHFIYSNDDMYIMNPCEPSDFFTEDGVPKFQMREIDAKTVKDQQYRIVCSNQWWKMRRRMGLKANKESYSRPYHSVSPMVKEKCIDALDVFGMAGVFDSISNFRQEKNMNQYIYLNYCALIGYQAQSEISFEYCSADKPKHLVDSFAGTKAQILCANDCATTLSPLQMTQLQILTAAVMERRFPDKCKYEKD